LGDERIRIDIGGGMGRREREGSTNALFMVILQAYALPKTEECHIEVRILSIIVVGPREYATA